MKKFTFPLRRVLDWRRTQAEIEESKLERFHAELRAIEAASQAAQKAGEDSGLLLLEAGSATGAELAALERFRQSCAAECARLERSAVASRQRILAQMQSVKDRRRDVKLLEHLHSRQLATWNADLGRELDKEASELHLAKLRSR